MTLPSNKCKHKANSSEMSQLQRYRGTGADPGFFKGVAFVKGGGVTIHCLITNVTWELASYRLNEALSQNGDD